MALPGSQVSVARGTVGVCLHLLGTSSTGQWRRNKKLAAQEYEREQEQQQQEEQQWEDFARSYRVPEPMPGGSAAVAAGGSAVAVHRTAAEDQRRRQ
eukprot:gene11813-11957_t